MQFLIYSHRFAAEILNSKLDLKNEIEEIIREINIESIVKRYSEENFEKKNLGKKENKGKQSTINNIFKEKFKKKNWEPEKNVFNDPTNDLTIDFFKREIGVDVAFNHRSFIGGDLLRLQAAAEVKNVIKSGVYICPTKDFAKIVSPSNCNSMVNFERTKWYLENFYPVFTVPIYLIGLHL